MPCPTCPYARLGVPAHCPGEGNPCRSLPLVRYLKVRPDTEAEVTVLPTTILEAALAVPFITKIEGETPLGRWTAYHSTLPGQTFNPIGTSLVCALGGDVSNGPLMGDVGFFGPLDEDGRPTDVPPEVVDLAARVLLD